MTTDIAELDATYRVAERVRVKLRDGHPVVAIDTAACRAEVALQGAQVLRWQPRGKADLLWCAPLPPVATGKAIRGGIPVCWPWFGPHPSDPAQPQHGLVRTVDWRLTETSELGDDIRIAFEVEKFGARLRLDVVAGATLHVALTTRNSSTEPLVVTEALHTYFHVGDIRRAEIHGLNGYRYRDNTDGGREKSWSGHGPMSRETIAVFEVAPDTAEIADPVLGRRIRIRRDGGRSTVAWHPGSNLAPLRDVTPGTERQFACIESGNVWSSAVTIAPGTEHRLAVSYQIAAM